MKNGAGVKIAKIWSIFSGKKRKYDKSKKSVKKKKKRKLDSDVSEPEFESDEAPFPGKRASSRKPKKEMKEEVQQPQVVARPVEKEDRPPTVAEICRNFNLNDVDLDFADIDISGLTTYRIFQQTFKQKIQGANPKVSSFTK